jgi:hypothetical protein
MKKRKQLSVYWVIMISVGILAIVLNILSLSHRICDFYIDHFFGFWVNTYGRFSGLFSFSLGEKMLIIGTILVLVTVISAVLLLFFRKRNGYRKYTRTLFKCFLAVLEAVVLIMTLNCTLLYGASSLRISDDAEKEEYTITELENLRNMLVENCNRLAEQIQRDENGYAVYSGDMNEQAAAAMHGISEEFPRLSGYYPKAKPIAASGLMSQMGICGVYYPFSMEANYNNRMYIMNVPAVLCHEYSHLKGYIFEDESNFLAYLACINSDDVFFQYSGYLSVLLYVDDSYYDSVDYERYCSQIEIDANVWDDTDFLLPEDWETVQEDAVFDMETVNAMSNQMMDSSLQFFGVEDGIASYDRVTELLLEYYRSID